ncbi:MAG: SPASM domain-containing protein [Christensenellales bacterium]
MNFIWPSLDHSYNTNLTRCLGGKKQFAILNDGSLCLCCLDYKGSTKIGNLFIDDFSTLLQNSNYLEAISGFNKRKPYFELCKKCTYRNRFK